MSSIPSAADIKVMTLERLDILLRLAAMSRAVCRAYYSGEKLFQAMDELRTMLAKLDELSGE